MAENTIMLRSCRGAAQLYRLLSILKMPASMLDLGVREFIIGSRGIDLAESYDSAQMLLVGSIVEPSAGDPLPLPPDREAERNAMRTVLVVDDEFGVAEVIEAILEEDGYRVLTAVNGRQGLARLAEYKPDLVLLDLMMPILDRPSMLRAMKADPAFKDIPVVMMSSARPRARSTRSASGYVAFLRKPFRAAAITDLVARLLGPAADRVLLGRRAQRAPPGRTVWPWRDGDGHHEGESARPAGPDSRTGRSGRMVQDLHPDGGAEHDQGHRGEQAEQAARHRPGRGQASSSRAPG